MILSCSPIKSKRFLDTYYVPQIFTRELVDRWTATGSPQECTEHLLCYREAGFDEITIRITGWDQKGQLKRVIDEVLPLLA